MRPDRYLQLDRRRRLTLVSITITDMSDLTRQQHGGTPAPLAADAEAARRFAQAARSDNTLRAYRSDWADFSDWCAERGFAALPAAPETVSLYIASRATAGPLGSNGRPGAPLAVSTLTRRLAAISQAHKLAGLPSPASRQVEPLHSVWAGLVRQRGVAVGKVAPALTADIVSMVQVIPAFAPPEADRDAQTRALRGKRDRALLLLGFAAALRRSELAAVGVGHVSVTPDGLRLAIPRSKTDAEGAGHVVGVAYGASPATCPVRAVQSWARAASDATGAPLSGPLFRKVDRWGSVGARGLSAKTVARVVKARAAAVGLDPALFSGHSLRAGFATQAARNGKSDRSIMRHTRHRSVRTLNEYVREGRLFDDNASDGLGL